MSDILSMKTISEPYCGLHSHHTLTELVSLYSMCCHYKGVTCQGSQPALSVVSSQQAATGVKPQWPVAKTTVAQQ